MKKKVKERRGEKKSDSHFFEVYGTVTPIAWDRGGTPVRFSIFTQDLDDIIIRNSCKNHKLRTLLNTPVVASGKLYENEYGDKYMILEKIKEVRGPSSPASASVGSRWFDEFNLCIPKNSNGLDGAECLRFLGDAC